LNEQKSAIAKVTAIIIGVIVVIVGTVGTLAAVSLSNSLTGSATVHLSATLNGAGSTLVYPLMSDWTYIYHQQVQTGVTVNYASIGSGGGIAQIIAKTVNFGATDAPMSNTQFGAAPGILHIPESISAVVPAYNIPGVTVSLNFTGSLLASIFLGNITIWNDPQIQALNPRVSLPNQPIIVVHRSDGSGTMYAFTQFLSDSSSVWASKVGYGTLVNWPTGLGGKGNEGVAGIITNTPYSIGPLEIAYVLAQHTTYGSVQNAAGNFIHANLTNVGLAVQAAASQRLPQGNQSWTNVSIVNAIHGDTSSPWIYPIVTFTYLLVYQHQTNLAQGAALVNFLWWIVNHGQEYGVPLGYVQLPASVISLDDNTIKSITYNGVSLCATYCGT
jgi:phosphate transport system substrate-binding protein